MTPFDAVFAASMAVLVVMLLFVAAFIVVAVFYLLTLQKCLATISPKNREMQPGMVWLMFIPLFNIVWQFIVVSKIANSAKKEAVDKNLQEIGDGGYAIGLAMCICNICSAIPFIGFLPGIAGFILWIIYWVKVAGMTRSFETAEPVAPAV